jgi:hypothetical protein
VICCRPSRPERLPDAEAFFGTDPLFHVGVDGHRPEADSADSEIPMVARDRRLLESPT